jgi:hypothetical protein
MLQYADLADLFTQHNTVKSVMKSSQNDERVETLELELQSADQKLAALHSCLSSIEAVNNTNSDDNDGDANGGDSNNNKNDEKTSVVKQQVDETARVAKQPAEARATLIERCISMAQAQHERAKQTASDADALRRRLSAYEHIVNKESKRTRGHQKTVGVAVAATSLMDDPSSAETRNKILEYDLSELTAERDKVCSCSYFSVSRRCSLRSSPNSC